MESILNLTISPQPTETTCGPTCLHAVYQYYGDDVSLSTLINEVAFLKTGGTLAVMLALHALKRGYKTTIYTYNLQVFDPTWFPDKVDILDKLKKQLILKNDDKLRYYSEPYLEYLELGGILKYEDLSPSLIRKYLKLNVPILTGLSSTYLYGHAREYGPKYDFDDLRGEPAGHFVVLSGYSRPEHTVLVADPLLIDNPYSQEHKYFVKIERLICSILLGIVTFDANLLIIEPKKSKNINVNTHSSKQYKRLEL